MFLYSSTLSFTIVIKFVDYFNFSDWYYGYLQLSQINSNFCRFHQSSIWVCEMLLYINLISMFMFVPIVYDLYPTCVSLWESKQIIPETRSVYVQLFCIRQHVNQIQSNIGDILMLVVIKYSIMVHSILLYWSPKKKIDMFYMMAI